MKKSSSRTLVALGLGTTAAAVVAARRVGAGWAAAEDGCLPGEALLPPGRSLTVVTDDGAEIAVSVVGTGPTVVLIHGWTCTREFWAPVAHRLVRSGHEVVLYDQRGHGSSTVGTDDLTIERLGADLAAVLQQLDVRDAVLSGHSMGGMAIHALATDHLEVLATHVRSLVLVATTAYGLGGGREAALAVRMVGSHGFSRILSSRFGHLLMRVGLGASVRGNHLVVMRDFFVACAPEVRAGCLTAMQAMDLREGIARIDMPVTVMVGTHDRATPANLAAELVEAIPGARLITLEGMGHQLPIEAPDEVAEALADAARGAAVAT